MIKITDKNGNQIQIFDGISDIKFAKKSDESVIKKKKDNILYLVPEE